MIINKKIFFSYAWRDMGLAQRIDEDLRRANIDVCRDKIDFPPGVNFQDEFLAQIDDCSHFILLDSANYREPKLEHWCKQEIDRFLVAQKKDSSKKLIICLAQLDGEWRKNELFPNQNLLLYIDFVIKHIDGCIYDNDAKYGKAIMELCEVFGTKYTPWIEQDCEQDLLDELKENNNVSERDRAFIIQDYETLRYCRMLNHSTTENRIRNFITDCETLSYISYTPHMFLLDFFVQADRYADCMETLQTLIQKFPDEPRAYRWLGTTNFYLKKYDKALQNYNKSLELSELPKHKKQKQYYNKIMLNMANVYIAIQDYVSASLQLNKYIVNEVIIQPEDLLYYYLQSFCHLALGTLDDCLNTLQNGLKVFPDSEQLYELLGHWYFRQNNFFQAINYYKIAIEKSISFSQQIESYTSLAQIYQYLGYEKELQDLVEKVEHDVVNFSNHLSDKDLENIETFYKYAFVEK
jgi:tetratricopeptide (TPR) repeat protein